MSGSTVSLSMFYKFRIGNLVGKISVESDKCRFWTFIVAMKHPNEMSSRQLVRSGAPGMEGGIWIIDINLAVS